MNLVYIGWIRAFSPACVPRKLVSENSLESCGVWIGDMVNESCFGVMQGHEDADVGAQLPVCS